MEKKNTVNRRGGGRLERVGLVTVNTTFFYFISPDQVTDIQN